MLNSNFLVAFFYYQVLKAIVEIIYLCRLERLNFAQNIACATFVVCYSVVCSYVISVLCH